MMVKRISFSGVSWSRTLMEELVMTTPEFSSTWMLLTDTTGLMSSTFCRTRRERKKKNQTSLHHLITVLSKESEDTSRYILGRIERLQIAAITLSAEG